MSSPTVHIHRIAVDTPLPTLLDYASNDKVALGVRVNVPFRNQTKCGVVFDHVEHSDIEATKLKTIAEAIDLSPLLNDHLIKLLSWAASYYHHPIGQVVSSALPKWLRQGRALHTPQTVWQATDSATPEVLDTLRKKAKVQAACLEHLLQAARPVAEEQLKSLGTSYKQALKSLLDKRLVTSEEQVLGQEANDLKHPVIRTPGPTLNDEQQVALDAIISHFSTAKNILLHGVTSSGKTEVYLQALREMFNTHTQALVLVPEIGLTPQTVKRFERRFNVPVLSFHSNLSDGERFNVWRHVQSGAPCIVIGTRSSVFLPFEDLGLIVIDEEHDASFKQQEGFRYSARDISLYRGQLAKCPVVMGTATPSLETLANCEREDARAFVRLNLTRRAAGAAFPTLLPIDLRKERVQAGLSDTLVTHMRKHLEAGGQALLYLNRRGFAPVWFCTDCGYTARCKQCDANLVYHQQHKRLHCHHCDTKQAVFETCPDCQEACKPAGVGTERVEEHLATLFDVPILRIDSDNTQRKGALEALFKTIHEGHPCILVGTQMLAKGHHFSNLSFVGIVNADEGLFGSDFRAMEKLAQAVVQVSGRAGRSEREGQVFIQTSFPEHAAFTTLLDSGYNGLSQMQLEERASADWPPFTHLALIRASSTNEKTPLLFLQHAKALAEHFDQDKKVTCLGPASAPMQKRGGRFHAQLLIKAPDRRDLHTFLTPWIHELRVNKELVRVRWSIDVDPIELF